MRNKIILYFVIVFALLGIVPVINFALGNKKIKLKELYSIDFALPYISKALYSQGVSIFAEQVYIGRNNWLFLGDMYENTVTQTRTGVKKSYMEKAISKNNTISGWNRYFLNQGVKNFKIMVGPNKSSIYSEYLPGWMKPAESKKIDMLMLKSTEDVYIYPKPTLLSAKEKYLEHDLYYKTDTHWNNLGGWIAFDEFIKQLRKNTPSIAYNQDIHLENKSGLKTGDLAKFLRLSGRLNDKDPVFRVMPEVSISTKCRKYYTGESYNCAGNPQIVSQAEPLLVISEGAENTKKVLWLRDSFGDAISPFMARTFSDVVQVHYGDTNKEKLVNLIEDFNPDFVFMTIVERNLDKGLPDSYPILELNDNKLGSYSSRIVSYNDIEKNNGIYFIRGNDPYLIYRLEIKTDANDTVGIKETLNKSQAGCSLW